MLKNKLYFKKSARSIWKKKNLKISWRHQERLELMVTEAFVMEEDTVFLKDEGQLHKKCWLSLKKEINSMRILNKIWTFFFSLKMVSRVRMKK